MIEELIEFRAGMHISEAIDLIVREAKSKGHAKGVFNGISITADARDSVADVAARYDFKLLCERLRAATMRTDWNNLPADACIPAVPLLREAAAALAAKDTALPEMAERVHYAEGIAVANIARANAAEAALSEMRGELERARKALKPFAAACPELFNDHCPDETPAWWNDFDDTSVASPITVGHFRAAARALSSLADGDSTDEAEDRERLEILETFHSEVWGWLLKRGLVDNDDDEWRGFVDVIEEHESEIEAGAVREERRRAAHADGVRSLSGEEKL